MLPSISWHVPLNLLDGSCEMGVMEANREGPHARAIEDNSSKAYEAFRLQLGSRLQTYLVRQGCSIMQPLLACCCLGTTCVNHCCPSWKVVCHCKANCCNAVPLMVTGGYGCHGHTFELPPARKCEHSGSPRQCPRRPQSTPLECCRSRFHGRSSGVTLSADVLVDGGGAELDVAAWSKGPLPRAEPLPEPVRVVMVMVGLLAELVRPWAIHLHLPLAPWARIA